MSKNITIAEGNAAKGFTGTGKLKTNLVAGGIQNWVPEDEAINYVDLATLTVTENGTYTAQGEGCDAFSEVVVEVEADPDLMEKTVTQNGTYKASDDGVDGYSQITVNVGGGGGGTIGDYYYPWEDRIESGIPYNAGQNLPNCFYNGQWNLFNTERRLILSGNTWSESTPGLPSPISGADGIVVYNNEIYAVGVYTQPYGDYNGFYVLRNGAWEALGHTPNKYTRGVVVHDGAIYCISSDGYGGSPRLYKYDGTWHDTGISSPSADFNSIQFYEGVLYLYVGQITSASGFYKLNGQTFEKQNINIPFSPNDAYLFEDGGKLHAIGQYPAFHYSYNKHWWRIEEHPTITWYFAAAGFDGEKIHFLSYVNGGDATHQTSEIVRA